MNMIPVVVKIISVQAVERPVKLRLPFQFGDTIVTETAEAFLQVKVEANGKTYDGLAAQLMVPRWFDKRVSQSNADTIETLRQTIRLASKSAIGLRGTVAEICSNVQLSVRDNVPSKTPQLAAGFGPALLEMALIDAACRAAGANFFQAARLDIFGLSKRSVSDTSPDQIRDGLSTIEPVWTTNIRHTIGYDAPLTGSDLVNAPNDGLPVALDDVIQNTGVKAFKIKLKGDVDSDLRRLEKIAPLIGKSGTYRATLDANEQYSVDAFTAFLKGFRSLGSLRELRHSTLFVEQPFAREIALEIAVSDEKFDLPLLIDESDDDDGSFAMALKHGWSGTSVKSCKSVFRALLNYCHAIAVRSAGKDAFLSGEDLTCQSGLCLQQDSLMAAAVGITHSERNGHHFAGGMQGASQHEIQQVLGAHGDLYHLVDGRPRLRIDNGKIQFRSLDTVGFGGAQSFSIAGNKGLCAHTLS